MKSETTQVDITICARCRGKHIGLKARLFSEGPVKEASGHVWTHWAVCPETGEPLFVRKLPAVHLTKDSSL